MKRRLLTIFFLLIAVMLVTGIAMADNVCKIGGNEYETLADAFNAANAAGGGTIELIDDATFSSTIHCSSEITLLGHGKTIYRTVNSFILMVDDGGILNLGSPENEEASELLITNNDSSGIINCFIQLGTYASQTVGTLNMYDGVVIGFSDATPGTAGGVQVEGNSVFNMYGGAIQNCHASLDGSYIGGGIFVDGCNFYGTKVSNPVFNMYDGTISGCTAYNGGAICAQGAEINLYGGNLLNNSASVLGGGILVYSDSTANLYGSSEETTLKISGNEAQWGGGIASYGNVLITGNTIITENRATEGAGVCAMYSGSITMTGGEICRNTATEAGGGIASYFVPVYMSSGAIHNNTASPENPEYYGDDILYASNSSYSSSLNLSSASAMNQKLDGTEFFIDGWYWDDESETDNTYRWRLAEAYKGNSGTNDNKGDTYSTITTAAIKAAFTAYDTIEITKNWIDYENSFESRPDSITFSLYDKTINEAVTDQNNNPATITLNASNSTDTKTWIGSISKLPVEDLSDTSKYELREEALDNYAITNNPVITKSPDSDYLYTITFENTFKRPLTVYNLKSELWSSKISHSERPAS